MTLSSRDWHETFVELMQSEPINNCNANWGCYHIDGVAIPYSIALKRKDNCYAVSPMTLVSGYAEEELPKINSAGVRLACKLLINIVKPILYFAGLDQVQTLNNQCLSTNMYSCEWANVDTVKLRCLALRKYPTLPVVLRSLNQHQYSGIIKRLESQQWHALTTRQVYVFDDWQLFHFSRDLKKDFKLLNDPCWQFKTLTTDSDFQRAKALYDMLYLEKYSFNNIQFSSRYLKEASQNKLLNLVGLYYRGEMLAVLGIVEIDQDMTCPIFGYDTTKPQHLALYRRISAYTIHYAKVHQRCFNMSSGAPTFKRNRNGRPVIECSYVYIAHLPFYRRLIWRGLFWLTQHIYQPLLLRFKL